MFLNWLSQIASVTLFNLRTIPARRGAVVAAGVGIAGVVAVFVAVLSIAEGFRRAMTASGSDDVALVMRGGADSEMTSILLRDDVRIVGDAPGILRTSEGALVSSELFVIINLPKRATGLDANVPFRGVEPAAYAVRGDVRIVQGRRFEPGRNEVIVGAGAAREFAGLDLGHKLRLGNNEWEVVGIFSAGGGVAESELWTDAAVLQPAYQRGTSYQIVYAKLESPGRFGVFKDALTSDPRLNVKVIRQSDFYADQSTLMTAFIRGIGTLIAVMMALGALFGALNTMYSAVAARVREIATLRALGFGAGPVVVSVLAESLVLAVVGGGLGALGAYLAFDGFTASMINYQSFSQVAFAFRVTPELLVRAVVLAAMIGMLGGLFPAIRAACMPIAAGLRES